jgi:hypothetical protein
VVSKLSSKEAKRKMLNLILLVSWNQEGQESPEELKNSLEVQEVTSEGQEVSSEVQEVTEEMTIEEIEETIEVVSSRVATEVVKKLELKTDKPLRRIPMSEVV